MVLTFNLANNLESIANLNNWYFHSLSGLLIENIFEYLSMVVLRKGILREVRKQTADFCQEISLSNDTYIALRTSPRKSSVNYV